MTTRKIKKSVEMTNVKIDFLSFVDKAANKHEWLIKKDQNGKSQFKFEGQIIKTETSDEVHKVVGIVYEPLAADTDDNFMSAEEIKKACDWFNENGLGSDIQHNEELLTGVKITKSYVVDEDTEIGDKVVKAGTWIAEAEIENETLWEKIEKAEITGWSMGGKGIYSAEDINIDEVEKSVSKKIFGKIAKAFGFTWDGEPVEEDAFNEIYQTKIKSKKFWTAFEVLQDILFPYDEQFGYEKHFQENEEVIKNALEDFSIEIKNILTSENISKALSADIEMVKKTENNINKAGKAISAANMNKLKNAQQVINDLVALEENKGDKEVEKAEVQKIIQEEIKKSLNHQDVKKENKEKSLEELVAKAVEEAMSVAGIEKEVKKEPTQEEVVADLVAKAMKPYLGSKQLEDEDIEKSQDEKVKKSVFSGIFGNTGL